MNIRQLFLLVAALGLLPIALSYGVMPKRSLGYLFNISALDTNSIHIFRAIMGLYLALALFWVIGAFKTHLRQAALWSLVVFMFGLAAGRGLSIILDGMPNWLLLGYFVLELIFGTVGLYLINKTEQ